MDASYFVVQFVGALGLVLVVSSFWLKRRKHIIAVQGLGSVCFGVHFLLLGAITAVMVNAILILRNLLFLKYSAADRPVWPLVSILLLATIPLIVAGFDWVSVLPVGALVVSTIGAWSRSEQTIRLWTLGAPPLWIVHNIITGSIPGVINEVLVFASIVGSWLRYRPRGRVRTEG